MQILVKKLEEAGYHSALYGLSLNKNTIISKMPEVAKRLCYKSGGHNKFLEHIIIWLTVTAPRYWWVEADTFRISTKQSESTIHTILKKPLTLENFENSDISDAYLKELNNLIDLKEFHFLKRRLPEGFLQTREWCMSYKTLQNIVIQRKNHILPHWRSFIDQVIEQIDHPEFIRDLLK